ncbi:MAG: FUSC family protein [Pseudomonadota bacterium]
MSLIAKLRARDPDLVNLRKSMRAAVVAVPLFALLEIYFDVGAIAVFAFFGCFVSLVLADFGGPRGHRAIAYLALLVVANLTVVVGSLLSDTVFAAALAMFVIMFVATFATVFGGYASLFVTPVALAYSLTVLDPISSLSIGDRVIGWTIGGAVALAAALLLWPVDRRLRLSKTLADVCDALADTLSCIDRQPEGKAALQRAATLVAEARQKASAPLRPAGPMSRDIGSLHLVQHLEQAMDLTGRLLERGTGGERDKQFIGECERAFRATGDALLGKDEEGTLLREMERLNEVLLAGRRVADEALAAAASDKEPEEQRRSKLLRSARRSSAILALLHVSIWMQASAVAALGLSARAGPITATPELAPLLDRPTDVSERARLIVASALDIRGVLFRNSFRGAVAMSVAILLAKLLPIEHSFWIMISTLAVLRSSAATTSASFVQAVVGTLLGFAISAGILTVVGGNSVYLWVATPAVVFIASYSPGVLGFLTGQTLFTVLVVLLFTLIDPAGLTTGIVRVETVMIGAASGVLCAFLLWPRGAQSALADAVAGQYRAAADAAHTLVDGPEEGRIAAARRVAAARRRADEAFGVALGERGNRVDASAWVSLSRAPNMVSTLAAGFLPSPAAWLAESCPDAVAVTKSRRDRVAALLAGVAEELDPSEPDHHSTIAAPEADDGEQKLADCLDYARPLGIEKINDARFLFVYYQCLSFVEEGVWQVRSELHRVAAASRPGAWLRWSATALNRGVPIAERDRRAVP